MKDEIKRCFEWYGALHSPIPHTPDAICPTRDIFQARLDTMYRGLFASESDEAAAPLITAIAGEIGNNCFDHNLGQWQDVLGCWFRYGREKDGTWILVADRGQGVLASLKRVLPTIKDEQEAVEIAFKKTVSGRAPEKRGNGLKFVRSVINGDPLRGLYFASSAGKTAFGGLASQLTQIMSSLMVKSRGTGTFALIFWKKKS